MPPRSVSQPLAGIRCPAAIASVLAAMAAAVLDATSINLALPAIGRGLGVNPSMAASLVVAYQASLLACLLPLAAIGERYGYRRTFVPGVCLFGLCALASGLASTIEVLLLLRIVQGSGAAAIMALGVAILRQTVAPDEFGKAVGWNAMAVALMSASGPTIGAALLGFGGWHFVFAGGFVLALVSLGAGLALPSDRGGARAIDGVSIMLYVAIVPTFFIGAGLILEWPAGSAMLLASGTAGIWLLVRRDRRQEAHFLPFDLLADPSFGRSVFASMACFAGMSLALVMLPFALHARLNTSPFETAMIMTPWPLAVLVTTPLTMKLLDQIAPRHLCGAGAFLLSLGLAILALAYRSSGFAVYLLGIALCGIGFGLFQTPNNRNMFLAAPVDRAASAGGLQGTARLTGQAVGALAAPLMLSALTVRGADVSAFGAASAAAFTAAMISLRRSKDD